MEESTNPFRSKFTKEEKEHILTMHASFASIPEIMKYTVEIKKPTTYCGIRSIVNAIKNKKFIAEMRDKYLQKVWETDISHKRFRLDALSRLFSHNEPNPARHHVALQALRQAREEVEGQGSLINLYNVNKLSDLSDEELIERYKRLTDKARDRGVNSIGGRVGETPATTGNKILSTEPGTEEFPLIG